MTLKRLISFLLAGAALVVTPAAAWAQKKSDGPDQRMPGERYHFEVSTQIWSPGLLGNITSTQLGVVGSQVDFGADLGLTSTRVTDLQFVLRPAKKHRLRAEFSPLQYSANATFSRVVNFAGVPFPVSVPIQTTFGWKTWKFGYEWDFIYRRRGFVGVIFEARNTTLKATLSSAFVGGLAQANAILPAVGVIGRAYIARGVSVDFSFSGLCVLHSNEGKFSMQCKEDANPDFQATYFDWDVHGTFNFTNNFGVQAGWRRSTALLNFGDARGQLKFQGLWFGGVARY